MYLKWCQGRHLRSAISTRGSLNQHADRPGHVEQNVDHLLESGGGRATTWCYTESGGRVAIMLCTKAAGGTSITPSAGGRAILSTGSQQEVEWWCPEEMEHGQHSWVELGNGRSILKVGGGGKMSRVVSKNALNHMAASREGEGAQFNRL